MKGKVYFALALICAAGAALSCYLYLGSVEQKYRETGNYVTVVTAGTDIPDRTSIATTMIKFKDLPERYVHPDAARSARDVIGKITLTDIKAGEPILKSKLVAEKDGSYGLAFSLAKGERACTIAVTPVSSVGEMVKPGDRVDVVATLDVVPPNPQMPKTTYTTIILNNIRVLATGQTLVAGEEKKEKKDAGIPHITLAVKPLQAQVLILASERGKVQLLLRSPVDDGIVKPPPTKLADLLAVPAVQVPNKK
ncbi:MAG: Flp pilus assembly protein CpaB [Bacillota bacterium]